MPGPRPTPTKLKLLRGNPGKRAINEHEPEPPVEILPVPDHLSDGAKAEWEVMAPLLAPMGLLTTIDRTTFEAYCTIVARWREAEDALKKTGPVVRAPSGYPMQSPYYTIANQSLSQMRAYLAEFGLSPASRSRISIKSSEATDPMEAFLYG